MLCCAALFAQTSLNYVEFKYTQATTLVYKILLCWPLCWHSFDLVWLSGMVFWEDSPWWWYTPWFCTRWFLWQYTTGWPLQSIGAGGWEINVPASSLGIGYDEPEKVFQQSINLQQLHSVQHHFGCSGGCSRAQTHALGSPRTATIPQESWKLHSHLHQQ